MKHIKPIISVLLVIIIAFGEVLFLASCTKQEKDLTEVKKGDYLSMLDSKFGFESYESEEPHVKNIGTENSLFSVIQAAYEWKVIDDSEIDLEEKATKEFVANTLVKAAGLEDVSEKDSKEIAKIAKDKGYITFDYKINKDDNDAVTISEAQESLNAAFKIYTDRDFGEGQYDVKWADGVKDLSSLSEKDYTINMDSKTVTLPKEQYEKLAGGKPEKGATIIVPARNNQTMKAYRIQSSESKGDFYELTISDDADYSKVADNYSYQFTKKVNLDEAEVTDGLGNPVSKSAIVSDVDLKEPPKVDYLGTDVDTSKKEVAKEGINFSIDGINISGYKSSEEIEFTASGTLYKSDTTNITFEKKFKVSDITVSHKTVDATLFSVKEVYLTVDYTTVSSGKLNFDYKKSGVFAPEYTNGNGKFSTNFQRAILKDSNAKGAKNIKICNISLAGCPAASIRLEVRLNISVSGEISLTITTNNTMGFHYVKGNGMSWIRDKNQQEDFSIHGKFEFSLYIGVGAYLLGSWVNVISGGASFGFGIVTDLKVHVKDDSNRQIDEYSVSGGNDSVADAILKDMDGMEYKHEEYGPIKLSHDSCLDVKFYWFIKAGLDPECKVKGFLKNIETEVTWGGEDNGVIWKKHYENGKEVSACTRHYDNVEATTTTTTDVSEETKQAAIFKVDSYNINVNVGGSAKANILEMPSGYSEKDVVFESENTDIATVDGSGNVRGVSDGSTLITAKTSDGKYKVTWSVSVTEK